jgi:hypothetical protein
MELLRRYRLLFLTLAILGLWIVAWATGLTGRFTSESMRSSLAALPMTALRWRDHLVGSALGLPVHVAVMAVFFDWLLHRTA